MVKYPNNEVSLEEASWAVNLSRGHTTLDAGIGTQGRDGIRRLWSEQAEEHLALTPEPNEIILSRKERQGAKGL